MQGKTMTRASLYPAGRHAPTGTLADRSHRLAASSSGTARIRWTRTRMAGGVGDEGEIPRDTRFVGQHDDSG